MTLPSGRSRSFPARPDSSYASSVKRLAVVPRRPLRGLTAHGRAEVPAPGARGGSSASSRRTTADLPFRRRPPAPGAPPGAINYDRVSRLPPGGSEHGTTAAVFSFSPPPPAPPGASGCGPAAWFACPRSIGSRAGVLMSLNAPAFWGTEPELGAITPGRLPLFAQVSNVGLPSTAPIPLAIDGATPPAERSSWLPPATGTPPGASGRGSAMWFSPAPGARWSASVHSVRTPLSSTLPPAPRS